MQAVHSTPFTNRRREITRRRKGATKLDTSKGMRIMKKLVFVAMMMVVSAGAVVAQAERFGTRQWKLSYLDGVNVHSSSRAYMELDAGENRMTGHTGCNRMFGTVDIQGRRIDISAIGTTKMACNDPRVRRIETALVKALENADRYRIRGNEAELYDRNRLVARFTAPSRQAPIEDRVGLEDRKWMLESVKNVPISKAGQGAFVVFDEAKGSAGGNSSCNVFGGQYTTNNRTIRITDVVATMRACIEDSRMNVEREFLDGLRQANRFSIERNKLMLYRNERLLLTFNGERK